MTDRGVPLGAAVATLSAWGIALTIGRIISGFCLDRVHGSLVATAFFIAPGLGIAVLAGGYSPFAGAILCGLGIGAEVDIMAFLVSRYFGLRCFRAICATMFALFGMGVGLGPYFLGPSHDRFGSYVPMMMVNLGLIVAMCLLLLGLGPYRFVAHGNLEGAAAVPAE